MCNHDDTKVTETRRHDGVIYRRRKCSCGAPSFVTAERPVARMPIELTSSSLKRLRKCEGRPRSVRRAEARALSWKPPSA